MLYKSFRCTGIAIALDKSEVQLFNALEKNARRKDINRKWFGWKTNWKGNNEYRGGWFLNDGQIF